MFKYNNSDDQLSIFSKEYNWNNFQKRRINKTWVKIFKEEIFPSINEKPFEVLYSKGYSRPNIPVNVIIGLLIIKELLSMTDEEVMDALMFDERVQYALNTINIENQFGSENTLNHFRKRLNDYYVNNNIDLLENELKKINEKLVELSGINSKYKRMDSMMISSSCKNLNRIELVYETNKIVVKKMEELNIKIKDFKIYLDNQRKDDILYKTKSSEENNKLAKLLHDSVRIYNRIKTNPKINNTKEFKMLERLIKDQYDRENKTPKSNQDIKPTSMQTPYDEDATYRFKYKNNIGYVGNIEETVEVDKDLNTKNKLISNWGVKTNIESDKGFMKNFIVNNKEKTVIVDSSYYSDELDKMAIKNNIEIHPTELVGKKIDDNLLNKFDISVDAKVLRCPKGQTPISSTYNQDKDIICAKFDVNKCNSCPLKNKCLVKINKKSSTLKTSKKSYDRHMMFIKRNDKDYIKISNLRAGIEGIPSVLRRRYNIDNRAGKGLLRLKIKFGCAIIAINTKRISKIAEICA